MEMEVEILTSLYVLLVRKHEQERLFHLPV